MTMVGRLTDRNRLAAAMGRLLLAPLLVAAALAGCSDDNSSDDAGDTTSSTTTEAAPTGGGEPVDGGEIRLGLPGPVVVDPVQANPGSPSDLMVLDLLHDGLVRVDTDGELQPAVASAWRQNDDATAFAFVIDPDATFASGEPITPEDVVASLERIAKGGDGSLAALRLEAVEGFREFVDGSADGLRGLELRNEGEIHIALSEPVAVLPQILAGPEFGIVDVDSLDEALDAEDPALMDLSGAWTVAEASGDEVRLARREAAPGHLDGVLLRSYESGEDAYDAFDDGAVDWALVPADRHADAVEDHGDDHFAPFHAELFFGLRVTSESPLSNRPLRQAIAAAVDTEAIVEEVYEDIADPLTGIVPTGVPGHEPGTCEGCGHDPDRAEALLEQAFPDGDIPTVEIDFDRSPRQEAMADLIADDLEAVGIPVRLRPQSLEDYKAFVVTGQQRLFSFGYIGGYASPDAYLNRLFISDADDNLTGYANGDVDASLAAARGGADNAAARWSNAESILLEAAVVMPVAQFRTQAVAADRVRGLAHAVDATVDWSQVWLVP